jgi:DNA-binding MarR family transcriptional regulator
MEERQVELSDEERPPRARRGHSRGAAEEVIEQLITDLPDWFAVTGRLSELVADQIGIGPTDLQCLHFLNQHGPASPSELAKRVGRSTGAVTRMIDRLENAGLVSRRHSDADRRAIEVRATTTGIARIQTYFDDVAADTRADLAGLSADELHLLLHFVRTSTHSATARLRSLLRDTQTGSRATGDHVAKRLLPKQLRR